VLCELLDQTIDKDGNKRPVYADSAYLSEAQEQRLADTHMTPAASVKKTSWQALEGGTARIQANQIQTASNMSLALRRTWAGLSYAPSASSVPR
jgi:hypothetical protein